MEVVMGTVVLLKVLHFISLFNVRYLWLHFAYLERLAI